LGLIHVTSFEATTQARKVEATMYQAGRSGVDEVDDERLVVNLCVGGGDSGVLSVAGAARMKSSAREVQRPVP
jgi:hypothetical protein